MNSYQSKEKLVLKNISKSYEDTLILEDISIKVNEGELVAILGPSGSGKSTIFNIITKLTKEDQGQVFVNGEISYMQQKDLLLPHKTIVDNISLPLVLKNKSKKEARINVEKYFKEFGLEGYEKKYPSELSGGMKQRANFLRTFVSSSDLMLLDEPFGALDSLTKTNMQEWLLDVRKKFNATIILITHDIEEAINLSDRIYLISNKPATVKAEFELKDKKQFEFGSKEHIKLKKDIISML